MDNKNTFKLLSEIIKKCDLKVVLIGGFAVNQYKVSRHTADVDFLITQENFNKIYSELKTAGFEEYIKQNVFISLRDINKNFWDIDFMLIEENTLEKIYTQGKLIDIAGYSFTVPSIKHLIALKLHSVKYNQEEREFKDIPDVADLIKLNRDLLSESDIKELCNEYGPEDIFEKIWKS